MFCKNCGAQNDDNVQFCAACGTALTDAAQAPVYQEPAAPVYVPVAAQPAKVPGKGLAIASLVLGLGKSEYAPIPEDEGFAVEFNFSIKPKGKKDAEEAKVEKTVVAEEAVIVEEAVMAEEAVEVEESVIVEEAEADHKADIAQ